VEQRAENAFENAKNIILILVYPKQGAPITMVVNTSEKGVEVAI